VLLAVPVVAGLVWLADRAHAGRLARLVGPRVPALAPDPSRSRRAVRRSLFTFGCFCALLATLHPVWGDDARAHEAEGVDIVLCLDVSRSMLASDVAPDRLSQAQAEIRALTERARGDRLALVAFAGEARTIVPLTRDGRTLSELADQTDPLVVEKGGTDLGAALEAALRLLPERAGASEAIVLLTDGEDLTGRGFAVASACRARGIAVHALGLGTALGSKIALPGEVGEAYLTDRQGGEVISALDATSLRRITDATGGAFVEAGTARNALVSLYDARILPLAKKAFEVESRRQRENRFQWPLAAALLCWLGALALPDRRRR
jgi:Ca-activated chloride channel family protein